MGELVICPICREIAEKKNRPMRQGDYAFVELKRIPEGIGGYCMKCRMFGYSTRILKKQEYDPDTKTFSFEYLLETSYKPDEEEKVVKHKGKKPKPNKKDKED